MQEFLCTLTWKGQSRKHWWFVTRYWNHIHLEISIVVPGAPAQVLMTRNPDTWSYCLSQQVFHLTVGELYMVNQLKLLMCITNSIHEDMKNSKSMLQVLSQHNGWWPGAELQISEWQWTEWGFYSKTGSQLGIYPGTDALLSHQQYWSMWQAKSARTRYKFTTGKAL